MTESVFCDLCACIPEDRWRSCQGSQIQRFPFVLFNEHRCIFHSAVRLINLSVRKAVLPPEKRKEQQKRLFARLFFLLPHSTIVWFGLARQSLHCSTRLKLTMEAFLQVHWLSFSFICAEHLQEYVTILQNAVMKWKRKKKMQKVHPQPRHYLLFVVYKTFPKLHSDKNIAWLSTQKNWSRWGLVLKIKKNNRKNKN